MSIRDKIKLDEFEKKFEEVKKYPLIQEQSCQSVAQQYQVYYITFMMKDGRTDTYDFDTDVNI